jgi:putative endopeptidase
MHATRSAAVLVLAALLLAPGAHVNAQEAPSAIPATPAAPGAPASPAASGTPAVPGTPVTPPTSLDPAHFDRTCEPCDDAYQFTNGGWIATNPIPPEYSSWNVFRELADRNDKVLRTILEAAMAKDDAPAGSVERLIGDFYCSCMDESRADLEGLEPLRPELARICSRSSTRWGSRRSSSSSRTRMPATPRRSSRSATRAASGCPTATTTRARTRPR